MFYAKRNGNNESVLVDITNNLGQTFVVGGAISPVTRNGGVRFQRTGWNELP